MKIVRLLFVVLLAGVVHAFAEEDIFDEVDDDLSVSRVNDQFRARLSGALDLEDYYFTLPAPGLIYSGDQKAIVNPRLSLFLDAQFGAHVYFFAQSRVDRGFDPSNEKAQARLDEFALRLTPWNDGRFNLQIGKFATAVGNWVPRHDSWDNAFITAPLPYENLTGVWDAEPAKAASILLQWAHVNPGLPANITAMEKDLRLPIIWGPSYAEGVAIAGDLGKFRYAIEVKHAALSSRPETWDAPEVQWHYPTISAHLGYQPSEMWNFGISANTGSYLRPDVEPTLVADHGRGDYRQIVVGQDTSFAWHHLQVWSEVYAARFEIPNVGNADTLAYYTEARYKFTPQFFGAVRWNQQLFGTIPDRGTNTKWGRDTWRVDFAPGYRFTAHIQAKVQYSIQRGDYTGKRAYSQLLSEQITVRF
jgi:hypothetical protein